MKPRRIVLNKRRTARRSREPSVSPPKEAKKHNKGSKSKAAKQLLIDSFFMKKESVAGSRLSQGATGDSGKKPSISESPSNHEGGKGKEAVGKSPGRKPLATLEKWRKSLIR